MTVKFYHARMKRYIIRIVSLWRYEVNFTTKVTNVLIYENAKLYFLETFLAYSTEQLRIALFEKCPDFRS